MNGLHFADPPPPPPRAIKSEVAIAQLLKVHAKSVLSAQQSVLRGLARRLVCSGLVVRVLWVPSCFQPADPMSRLQGDFGGNRLNAERMAWLIYKQLLDRHCVSVSCGVVPGHGHGFVARACVGYHVGGCCFLCWPASSCSVPEPPGFDTPSAPYFGCFLCCLG